MFYFVCFFLLLHCDGVDMSTVYWFVYSAFYIMRARVTEYSYAVVSVLRQCLPELPADTSECLAPECRFSQNNQGIYYTLSCFVKKPLNHHHHHRCPNSSDEW